MSLLRLEIAWAAGAAPRLVSLVDNGCEVLQAPRPARDHRLAAQWEADDTVSHALIWQVVASDGLTSALVTAAWEDGPPQVLALAAATRPRWSERGVVRRRGVE
jgi:hypothetical protein